MVSLAAKNITAVYRSASDEQKLSGLLWYKEANALAHELDPNDPVRAAAVIAVLSPRLPWPKNIEAARDAYAGRKLRVLGLNALKAQQLLSGEKPDDIVKGPKVRAFWHAIVNPNDGRAVVVDRHSFDVAAGVVTDDETRSILSRKGMYENVVKLYVRASHILTRETGTLITPVEVQATTWVAWRESKRGMAA